MFVKLNNNIINTSKITYIKGNTVFFNDSFSLELGGKDIATLHNELFPDYTVSTKIPKENDSSALLNTLHSLLGGRGEAKLTTDRRARLSTRLKDFTPEELKQAAQNLGSDEFMQGANDNGKRYGTIDYLLRTSANVNKWLEEQPQKKKGMF